MIAANKIIFLLPGLIGICFVAVVNGQNSYPVTKQPLTVDEKLIEVNLVPDKSTVMLGEPVYLSFVVENNSDHDLQVIVDGDYRNALGRPETFSDSS